MTRIVVDPARQIGSVGTNVFGGFVEHLGRCIYGGLDDEGSPLADARGFRTDVLGLLRELRMGVLCWPGGNFVSNYHWADGIGPRTAGPAAPSWPGAPRSPTASAPTSSWPTADKIGAEALRPGHRAGHHLGRSQRLTGPPGQHCGPHPPQHVPLLDFDVVWAWRGNVMAGLSPRTVTIGTT